jgi:hypothetical protein
MQALTQCEQTLSTLGVGQEVVMIEGCYFVSLWAWAWAKEKD